MIKLSVIIPLFNGQDTILRAIHSVENQSMTVIYEIIVVMMDLQIVLKGLFGIIYH